MYSRFVPIKTMLKHQPTGKKVVSERLGHNSISIPEDIYSHIIPGMQESAAKSFDDTIIAKYNKVVKQQTP